MSDSVPGCGFVCASQEFNRVFSGTLAGATLALADLFLGGFVAGGVSAMLDAGAIDFSFPAIAASSLVSV